MAPLLTISDLRVSYVRDEGPKTILSGIDLSINAGQSLGIVGESGSGKTVLIRSALGLLRAPWRIERGSISFDGEDLLRKPEEDLERLRGRDIALTSPEPRKHLDPLLCIGDQIANAILAHRDVSRDKATARARELLQLVGIPDPHRRLRSYPHELSGGMCQRVIIAMALAHSPKLLLADEPTAGLDVTISRQILDLMRDLVNQAGSALVLVSRDLGVVAHYCQRVAVMYAGRIVEIGDVPSFFTAAAHPYSRNLIRAATAARDQSQPSGAGLGQRTAAVETGCNYAPRCPVALPICVASAPALEAVQPDYFARCHRKSELVSGRLEA